MAKLLREITPDLARNAYRHLSHFAAVNEEKQLAEHLWEHIVIQALVHLPGARLGELVGKVAEIFGLELEDFEVHSVLVRLAKQRKIREVKGRSPKFYPNSELAQQIRDEWKESRELEFRVMETWGEEVGKRHAITDEDLTQLKSDIRDFLTTMLRQYGADCAKLTGPGAPHEVHRVVGAGLEQALASLPTASEFVNQLRRQELPLFFVSSDDNRLEFIRQMTQAMYVLFAVEVDPDLSTLLISNYAGGHVILDTNLAYCLLGLDGPQLQRAMAALLKYSRALGYEPVISLKTVEELTQIVKGKLADLLSVKHELSPAYMQQILDDPTYADDVFKAYYRCFLQEYRRTGRKLTREAFALMYEHPEEAIAREYGVKVLSDHHEWVCAQTERLQDLTEKVIGASAHRSDGPKGFWTAQHDAFNHILAQRLRGAVPPRRFVDAKAWLVTNDRTLLIADGRCLKSTELPIVILAESWIQMTRLSLPRSINGDAGFASLLAAPYLRNAQIPSRVADLIGGYLALESAAAPELQVKMLQDKMLTDRLQRATSEEIQIELDQAAARIAAEEAERRQQAERQLEQQTLAAEASTAQAEKLAQRMLLHNVEKEVLSLENQELQRRVAALEAQEKERQHEEWAKRRNQQLHEFRRAKNRRLVGRLLIVALLVAFGATTSLWRTWPILQRVLLACGVASALAVLVLWVDSLLGIKRAFLRWLPWALSNLAILMGGYGVANLAGSQRLSDLIVTLSVVASLLANPISGAYLPAPIPPQDPPHDEAA